jgi:hypothetical protein
MFGFMAAPCPRCTSGSFPAWRGVFCGLSRCLAREFGQPARVLVNRDAAFIGLLGISLDPKTPRWKQATCCNPLTHPFPVVDDHPALLHAAAVTICGLATKLKDDVCDEGLLRRVLARAGGILTAPAADRAVAMLNSTSFPTAEVVDCLARQEAFESAEPLRADVPTAGAYGAIVSHLAMVLELPARRDALHRAGSALGSLVYWRDAWQDRREDTRRGRFNPFACVDQREIQHRIGTAWSEFTTTLAGMGFPRHVELIAGVRNATERKRCSFLNLQSDESAGKKKETKKRKTKETDSGRSCWQRCDCCDCVPCPSPRKGGCCDAAFDCGPGDTGCCDCNPCDGCECCPCH